MSIRILFTIPNFITAGSGRAMLNVIERLDRRRYEPSICVAKSGGGDLWEQARHTKVPLIEAPFTVSARPVPSLPFRVWSCAQAFRPLRFDLWHSFHYLDDYTEPLIARAAGARAWVYTKKNMNWRRKSWYVRTLLSTRIAAQNTTMISEFFKPALFRGKVSLVAPGVDHQLYRPEGEGLGTRARLGLSADVPLIGIVAHLLPVKGHGTLIRAAANVRDAHVVLAGKPQDENYVAQLRQLIADLGMTSRVHFLGGVSDVPALLRDLDVFVLSTVSRGEGCPVALLEAMACGRACIASRVSGCVDVIEDGQSGLLVESENATALEGALRELCSSPEQRRRLGANARRRIEANYTMSRETAQYESLYSSALGL